MTATILNFEQYVSALTEAYDNGEIDRETYLRGIRPEEYKAAVERVTSSHPELTEEAQPAKTGFWRSVGPILAKSLIHPFFDKNWDPGLADRQAEAAFVARWGFSGVACGFNPYKSNLYAGLAPKYGGYDSGDFTTPGQVK